MKIRYWYDILFIGVILIIFIGSIVNIYVLTKESNKTAEPKKVLAEKLIWHVSKFEQHYDAGFVGTYNTDVTIEPINGKWPYEKPWFNYQDSDGYRYPNDWKPFVEDKNRKFKIEIDYLSTSGAANANVNGWWKPVPLN